MSIDVKTISEAAHTSDTDVVMIDYPEVGKQSTNPLSTDKHPLFLETSAGELSCETSTDRERDDIEPDNRKERTVILAESENILGELGKTETKFRERRNDEESDMQKLSREAQELNDSLKKAQIELERSKEQQDLLIQANDELQRRNRELTEYQNQAHNELQERLQELNRKDQDLGDIRKRWRQAANELNRFLAQGQGFSQVTDQELIQRATQLRFNIRSFAFQHFGGRLSESKAIDKYWEFANTYLAISFESFEASMQSPSKRPMITEALLWGILMYDILGRFCWAGEPVSDAISRLIRVLSKYTVEEMSKLRTKFITPIVGPMENASSSIDQGAMRKFQTWKANTATLLTEALDRHGKTNEGARFALLDDEIDKICRFLDAFSESKYEDLEEQVSQIVDEACEMDIAISKQAAEVVWLQRRKQDSRLFDPELMELERGEKSVEGSQNVWLMLAPGLIKRGKSNGEDFHVQNLLLKMQVSCKTKIIVRREKSEEPEVGSIGKRMKDVVKSTVWR